MGSNTRSSEAEPLLMKIVALRANLKAMQASTLMQYATGVDNVRIEQMLDLNQEILDDVYDALV